MSKYSYEAYIALLRSREPRPSLSDVRELVTHTPKVATTAFGYAFASVLLIAGALIVLMSFASSDSIRIDRAVQTDVSSVIDRVRFVESHKVVKKEQVATSYSTESAPVVTKVEDIPSLNLCAHRDR